MPIAGKYRLIDIPISNCLNANLRHIFVLTQFNSESLNKHVAQTYKFDVFSSGFVTVLAAEQTEEGGNWFQGTADAVPRQRVQAHVYRGYWEDVGTIHSYFQANLALCEPIPPFDFYDAAAPVYTHPRFLPASKLERCNIHNALISEGCILHGAEIDRAVIGIRSRIGSKVRLRNSLLIGADFYETIAEMEASEQRGVPPIGIGSDSIIEGAIIDKNARIGRGVRIVNEAGTKEKDGDGYFIREGIVIVPKNAVIPNGMVI